MDAVWQFKFDLVPEAGLVLVHGSVPPVLDEYRDSDWDDLSNVDFDALPNYWAGRDAYALSAAFSLLLEPLDEPTSAWRRYGDFDDGNAAWITPEGVSCGLDLRDFSPELAREFIGIAHRSACKIAVNGSGAVIDPEWNNMAFQIRTSTAARFVRNPTEFIGRLAGLAD
jgi:hypothetical protein